MTKQLVPAWLRDLPTFWKVLGIVLTVLAVGATRLAPIIGLPAKVDANEKRGIANEHDIQALRSDQSATVARLDRVLCILEANAKGEDPTRCIR